MHASSRGSESTLEETAALDQLIDILLSAKDNTEVEHSIMSGQIVGGAYFLLICASLILLGL